MTSLDLAPPREDELEISLFGPGRGECVVLHIGHNEWIIVDSCVDRSDRLPVAIKYLEGFGVSFDAGVKLLAVTHWHDDHIRGASQLLRKCPGAVFVCSVAFLASEFSQFVNAFHTRFLSLTSDSGTDEFAEIMMQLRKEHTGKRPQSQRLLWAVENKMLLKTDAADRAFPVTMYALAPSDASVTLSLNTFKDLMPKEKTAKRRALALLPNEVSTAFWLNAGIYNVLLGGDLETGCNDGVGWRAVVKSGLRPKGEAVVIKVPHHGSRNAYYPPMWEEMASPNSIALVPPFSSGKKPLPSEEDVIAIKKHTHRVYCTGQPRGWKPPRRNSTADKFMDSIAISRRRVEGPLGQVCVRMSQNGKSEVKVFPPACSL